MRRILVIDNYDSFTYNLVYLLLKYAQVEVVKNDQVEMTEINAYDKILFSPGPGIPSEAGKMCSVIEKYAGVKPLLGICLGHQAIGEVFGAKLKNLDKVYHGVATPVILKTQSHYLFKDLPESFSVGRYHSWVVEKETVGAALEITAEDNKGMVMGLSHKNHDINGLQFHPESIMTEHGETMIANWVQH